MNLRLRSVLNSDKISSALDQTWRRILQPFSFALFGLGALALGAIAFPLMWMLPVSAARKTGWIQKVIHYSFRFFLGFLEIFKGMEFRFEGVELLRSGGGVIIANHPTLLDVVLLVSRLPQADCIVKKELWNNFFLRLIVEWSGYIPNDDGPELAQKAMERVRQGRKVIIFPEGTRSLPESLRPFTKGFAHIAVRSGCFLWPVVITCHPSTLTKDRSVFSVPVRRPRLQARAGESLDPAAYFDATDSASIAARKVTAAMQRYFEEKVDYAGFGKT